MTFSAAVSVGSSWKNWKTMPTARPRQAEISRSRSACTGVPPTTTSPLVGRSMPASRPSSVDLPLPEGRPRQPLAAAT